MNAVSLNIGPVINWHWSTAPFVAAVLRIGQICASKDFCRDAGGLGALANGTGPTYIMQY